MSSIFDNIDSVDDVERILIKAAIRETENLDYVGAHEPINDRFKNENIAKLVGAMANGPGGTVVYGVRCYEKEKDLPESIGGVDPANPQIIEGVVRDCLEPELSGWRIKPLPSSKEPTVVLVDVPESDSAPHQCKYDRVYYGRKGPHSKPLAHHEIARIMLARQILARLAEPVLVFYQVQSLPIAIDQSTQFQGMIKNVGNALAIGVQVYVNNYPIRQAPALPSGEELRSRAYLVPRSAWAATPASSGELEIKYHDMMGAIYRTFFQLAADEHGNITVGHEPRHFKNGRRLFPR